MYPSALLDLLAGWPSEDGPDVHVTGDEQPFTATLPDGDHLTLDDQTTAALDEVQRAGRLAGAILAAARSHRHALAEQRVGDARAATRARYQNPDAGLLGLRAVGGRWVLDGADTVTVTSADLPSRSWSRPEWAAAFAVAVHGKPVGTVRVDVDGHVTAEGRHRNVTAVALGGDPAARQLVREDPWRTTEPPAFARVGDAAAWLANQSAAAREWTEAVDAALARQANLAAEREQEAVEWAKASRSRDRIPNGKLNTWMRDNSYVDHYADGLPKSGYKLAAEHVVGRKRPRHLDGNGRRKAVGVSELLYVARVVHVDARSGRPAGYHTFSDRQRSELADLLPGCVVEATEDRKALFVAFDAPQYREALDAALVAWVMMPRDET